MSAGLSSALTYGGALAPGVLVGTQLTTLARDAAIYRLTDEGQDLAEWWCINDRPHRCPTLVLRSLGSSPVDLLMAQGRNEEDGRWSMVITDSCDDLVGSVVRIPSRISYPQMLLEDAAGVQIGGLKLKGGQFRLSDKSAGIQLTQRPTGRNLVPAAVHRITVRQPVEWPLPALLVAAALVNPIWSGLLLKRPGAPTAEKPRTLLEQVSDGMTGLNFPT